MVDISSASWNENAGSNNAAPPDGWPEGQTWASVNNTAREMMAAIKRQFNREHVTEVAGGTANALTLTYDVAPAAYHNGDAFTFYASATNTAANPTLNVNGLGAQTIRRRNYATVQPGDIQAGSPIEVFWDGTNFRLMSATDRFLPADPGLLALLTNGFHLRWGAGSVGAAGMTPVGYVDPFPTLTLCVVPAIAHDGPGAPPAGVVVTAGNLTASGFDLGSSAGPVGYRYIAIGA